MPEEELDLLQFAASGAAESGTALPHAALAALD
jgi:hypothetical protein